MGSCLLTHYTDEAGEEIEPVISLTLLASRVFCSIHRAVDPPGLHCNAARGLYACGCNRDLAGSSSIPRIEV